MIWHLLTIYLTGVVVFFTVFSDEFDHGESWVVLLWPMLTTAVLLNKLGRALTWLWSKVQECR